MSSQKRAKGFEHAFEQYIVLSTLTSTVVANLLLHDTSLTDISMLFVVMLALRLLFLPLIVSMFLWLVSYLPRSYSRSVVLRLWAWYPATNFGLITAGMLIFYMFFAPTVYTSPAFAFQFIWAIVLVFLGWAPIGTICILRPILSVYVSAKRGSWLGRRVPKHRIASLLVLCALGEATMIVLLWLIVLW